MKSILYREKTRRQLFLQYEKKRILIKYLQNSPGLEPLKTFYLSQILFSLKKESSITRLRNRCVFTSRGRGVLPKHRLSRIKLRELLSQGFLPGYTKSSW